MSDVLTDYETQVVKKPKLFWIVFSLYLGQVVIANLTNTRIFFAIGFAEAIQNYKAGLILGLLDLFQLYLVYLLFRKSKIAWCLIILVQGMYASIFIKKYYVLLSAPGIPHLDIILNNPISLFFCVNSILIVLLLSLPGLSTYFNISTKLRVVILSLLFIDLFAILFFFF